MDSSEERGKLEFWRALTRPSPGSLAIMVGVVLAQFLLSLLLVSEELVAAITPRLLVHFDMEDHAFAHVKLSQLPRAEASRNQVVILGSSATREAISREELLEERLLDRLGHPVEVHNLTLWDGTLADLVMMSDRLQHWQGTVLIGLSMRMMRADPRQVVNRRLRKPSLGFVSESLDAEGERMGCEVPNRTGNYFLDNRRYLADHIPNISRNLWNGEVEQSFDRFHRKPAMGDEYWKRAARKAGPLLGRSGERSERRNCPILSRIVRGLRQNPARVILFQNPVNPRFIAEVTGPEEYENYLEGMRGFAERNAAEFWEFDEEIRLEDEEFRDEYHLRSPEAQLRYIDALGARLAEALAPRGRRSGS